MVFVEQGERVLNRYILQRYFWLIVVSTPRR
jgi:hypothetical protein